MRQPFSFRDLFTSKLYKADIVIDKNGLHLENHDEQHSLHDICRKFLGHCLNLDEWKHTWHISVDSAMRRGTKERKDVREILEGKIKDRESEIQELKNALHILRRIR